MKKEISVKDLTIGILGGLAGAAAYKFVKRVLRGTCINGDLFVKTGTTVLSFIAGCDICGHCYKKINKLYEIIMSSTEGGEE